MPDRTATTVGDCFTRCVLAPFGGARRVVSDKGVEFTATYFTQLVSNYGSQASTVPTGHSEINGAAERPWRWLKDNVRAK